MVKYKCGYCGYVFDHEEMERLFGKQVKCPRCARHIIYKVARVYRLVKAV